MKRIVLIAGAGPVGLTMALALKRRGVEVRIVEKGAARTSQSRALVVWPRTLELLDIEGCVESFLGTGIKGNGVRIFADGRELVHVDLGRARSVYRFALLIPQSETERLLEEHLARVSLSVERTVALQSFTQDEDAVVATLQSADGATESVRAEYLVSCEGAHSTVRRALGIEFEGNTLPSDWVLADLFVDGPLAGDEVMVCMSRHHGVLALFPIIGGRMRVIYDIGLASSEPRPTPTLGEIQAVLDERTPLGLRAHDPVWLSHFRINERKVRDYRKGRVFLAGDAAHVHSPAGGQGMNTGMQDALNLAWKLALVWHGNAEATLLESYSAERSWVGEQVLRNAGLMTRFGTLQNPVLQEIRNVAASTLGRLAVLQQHLVDQVTEIDVHYPQSPISASPRGAATHPAAGERAPDVALDAQPDGARRLHEALASGRFVALSVDLPPVTIAAGLEPLALAARAPASAPYESGHVYLIRPDAYVAMSAPAAGASAVVDRELRRICGRPGSV